MLVDEWVALVGRENGHVTYDQTKPFYSVSFFFFPSNYKDQLFQLCSSQKQHDLELVIKKWKY